MNLAEMLKNQNFIVWQSDHINNIAIDDPSRYNRCRKAAEHGADGSTHAEMMEDWMEFLEFHSDGLDISSGEYHRLLAEIHDLWDWHDKHGSLHEEVG